MPLEEIDARLNALGDITHIENGTYNAPAVKAERESRSYFKRFERKQ